MARARPTLVLAAPDQPASRAPAAPAPRLLRQVRAWARSVADWTPTAAEVEILNKTAELIEEVIAR